MQLSLEDDVFVGTHGRQGIAGTTFSHDIMKPALTSLAPIIVLWAVLQNHFCFPVVRMSWHTPPWHTPPCYTMLCLLRQLVFLCSYLNGGTIPTSLLVWQKPFLLPCFCPFYGVLVIYEICIPNLDYIQYYCALA